MDPMPIARRLRLTRDALRLTQRELAGAAGIATNTYGQWESGTRLIQPGAAVKLCDTHGLTLDWIYRGEPGDMPHKLVSAIRALQELDKSVEQPSEASTKTRQRHSSRKA